MKTLKDKTCYLLFENFINVSPEGMFLQVRERRKKYLKQSKTKRKKKLAMAKVISLDQRKQQGETRKENSGEKKIA